MKKVFLFIAIALSTTCFAQGKLTDTLKLGGVYGQTTISGTRTARIEIEKDSTWKDTVSVTLLVSDTIAIGYVYTIKAYSIRNGHYEDVGVSTNPNTTNYLGNGIYSTTLLDWLPRWERKAFYTHLEYLDDKKRPLSKSIIVWQSK